MKETMTVHKALAELKVLNSRINDAISSSTFVVQNKHSNTKIGGIPIAEFCSNARDYYKSICTLINRRNAIKRAVTKSNAVTEVTVGKATYTVAEAIDMKSCGVSYLEILKDRIQNQYDNAQVLADRSNGERLEQRCDEYIKTMYQGVDMKNMSDEIKKVRDDFITAQTVEIVDPIDARKVIKNLEEQINSFMTEVDSALSVSNALTTIEVEYETL